MLKNSREASYSTDAVNRRGIKVEPPRTKEISTTTGKTLTADIPGTPWTSNISSDTNNSRGISNREDAGKSSEDSIHKKLIRNPSIDGRDLS
jgi:hypothetical protein